MNGPEGRAGSFAIVRVAVLASGSGTLLEAILAEDIPVDVVMVDRPCRATEVASAAGVEAVVAERGSFGADFDRDGYSADVAATLVDRGIDLVVMAGWGTVFAAPMFDAFPHRILNTHPALLPSFKGWHAVEAAMDFGVKVTGCTIHVATVEIDAGPILAQEAVAILDDDTVDTLHERIKAVERRLYPATIRAVLANPAVLDRTTSESHE